MTTTTSKIDLTSRESQVWGTFDTVRDELLRGMSPARFTARDKSEVKDMIADAMDALRAEGFVAAPFGADNCLRQSHSNYLVRPLDADGKTLIGVVSKQQSREDGGEVHVRIYDASKHTIHYINDTYDSLPLAEKHALSGFGETPEKWLAWMDRQGYTRPGDGCK